MLTCFIRHNIQKPGQYFSMSTLLIVPVVYLGYYIYAFVVIFRKYKVQANKEFKILIVKYLIYSLIYILFYFPIILLYLLTMNKDISTEYDLRWFAYVKDHFKVKVLHDIYYHNKSNPKHNEDN